MKLFISILPKAENGLKESDNVQNQMSLFISILPKAENGLKGVC